MLVHMTQQPNTVEELKLYNSFGIIPPGVSGLGEEGKTTATILQAIGQTVKDVGSVIRPVKTDRTVTPMPMPGPERDSGWTKWLLIGGGVLLAGALGVGIFKAIKRRKG